MGTPKLADFGLAPLLPGPGERDTDAVSRFTFSSDKAGFPEDYTGESSGQGIETF